MTIAFIANVGSRDVQVAGEETTKESRRLGETILADWDTHRSRVQLPILGKALEYVIKKHQMIDSIVLFATNQRDSTYRYSDTLPFAQIIKRYLIETYGDWVDDALAIVEINENPSDYDAMMRFYEHELTAFQGVDQTYIEVTGGTPAMSFMLLWQGVDKLGQRARPLYVLEQIRKPRALNVGLKLLASTLDTALKRSIDVYQYNAALQLLDANQELLRDHWRHFEAIAGLLDYARQRLNFNFELAENALFGLDRSLGSSDGERVLRLADEIAERDEAWVLREEIFGAEIDFRTGTYKDAVTNVFAFREGLLRYYAARADVPVIDGKNLDLGWLDTQPDLKKYLEDKKVRVDGAITTFAYQRILGFLAKSDPAIDAVLQQIASFEKLADIRNTAIHSHSGVALPLIENAYPGGVDAILAQMRQLYETVSGQRVASNPYDGINDLIVDLLEQQQ